MENRNVIQSLQQKLKQKETALMASEAELVASMAEQKVCGMCYDPIDDDHLPMVFFPCGHARFCQFCYGSLPNPKKCPECRVKIQNATVLFQ